MMMMMILDISTLVLCRERERVAVSDYFSKYRRTMMLLLLLLLLLIMLSSPTWFCAFTVDWSKSPTFPSSELLICCSSFFCTFVYNYLSTHTNTHSTSSSGYTKLPSPNKRPSSLWNGKSTFNILNRLDGRSNRSKWDCWSILVRSRRDNSFNND